MLNSLQRYKKNAILARKICDFKQKNLRFYIQLSIRHDKFGPIITIRHILAYVNHLL